MRLVVEEAGRKGPTTPPPGKPRRQGLSWEDDERMVLVRRHLEGVPPGEIARLHHRTRNAITSELKKIGFVLGGRATGT